MDLCSPKLNAGATPIAAHNFLILNRLRQRQNSRRFPDNIFKCIFLNENVWYMIKIPLKFVLFKGRIDNIPGLVQIMIWYRAGDKPLFEPLMVSLLRHICINASLDRNELKCQSRIHQGPKLYCHFTCRCLNKKRQNNKHLKILVQSSHQVLQVSLSNIINHHCISTPIITTGTSNTSV